MKKLISTMTIIPEQCTDEIVHKSDISDLLNDRTFTF